MKKQHTHKLKQANQVRKQIKELKALSFQKKQKWKNFVQNLRQKSYEAASVRIRSTYCRS